MDELASLDQSTRESALERFRIIQPCLEEDTPLSLIAREAGIPYRTIQMRKFGCNILAVVPQYDIIKESPFVVR
jgi:hypothetical protein